MSGLIGKKVGMTSIFDDNGKNIPCTVIEAGPCIVTQVRTEDVDGYQAIQLGFDDATEKSATKAEIGHAKGQVVRVSRVGDPEGAVAVGPAELRPRAAPGRGGQGRQRPESDRSACEAAHGMGHPTSSR